MNLWLAALIILGAAALSVAAMLVVRRVAPRGSYFKDAVPADALYTAIGTAYMVILAFVFLVAFESYHAARDEAQNEATATLAMFHAAQPVSSKTRNQLQGQVICYAREVISKEWPAMRDGTTSSAVEARITAMENDAERQAPNRAPSTRSGRLPTPSGDRDGRAESPKPRRSCPRSYGWSSSSAR